MCFTIHRPTLDQYFTEIATVVAKRSTCLRNQVGAVFVKNKRILSTGYNGAPAGLDHCDKVGCARENVESGTHHELCRAVHAEQNAIIQAAHLGQSIAGGTLYCTNHPCVICAKMILNAGIRRIVVREGYPDQLGADLLKETGLQLEFLEERQTK